MNCKEIEEREIAELYLLDRLSEPDRDEFEKHYFECSSCFFQLQTGLAVQAELRHHSPSPARARGAGFRIWAWTPALVTVVLLCVVGIWYSSQKRLPSQQTSTPPPKAGPEVALRPQPPSPAAPSLEELARVEPPPYSAVVLRGPEDQGEETFGKAMQYYVKANYAHAIPGLQAALEASPQSAKFNFYLGACYLLTSKTDPAIESFRKTVSLGDSTYFGPAHFYLAKAYLRKKDIPAAEDELQKTVKLHGGMEAEATKILGQLGK